MNVIKRNSAKEKLNTDKILASYQWAKEGLDVDLFELITDTKLHFYDNMTTSEIHDAGIVSCRNLLSEYKPDYDIMGARLFMQKAYAEAHQSKDMPHLKDYIVKMVKNGMYSDTLLTYTDEEFEKLNSTIDKSKDFNFTLSGIEQLYDKYAIKNTEFIVETPQLMFMAEAMGAFYDYKLNVDGLDKMYFTLDMYDSLSNFDISLPSPMMSALRTTSTDYASCITLRTADNLDSWVEMFGALVKHTAASAGIGVDISDIASIADLVKDGKIEHGGKIPLMKAIDALIQVASQNGRRGQAVDYINFFDPEIETIMGIKSPRTEVTKRINDLKHGIKFNRLVYERAQRGEDISLFSVRKAPEVYRLFNSKDYDGFVKAYEEAEAKGLAATTMNARELMLMFVTERTEVGIYYVMNIDEANTNTPYDEDISQSNICVEFIVPTKPLQSDRPNEPAVGVCILSNINQAAVGLEELPNKTRLLVYMLNNIMHRQNHPTGQAQAFVEQYATLGIGFANHALWMAKNGWKYGDKEALEAHNLWMEHFQYYLLRASCDYAREHNAKISRMDKVSYSRGVMPMDRYNKNVDELVASETTLDWVTLRKDIIKYGLANASLSMIPPSETSSVIGGMDSSMEPLKKLMTVKTTKGVALKQLAAGVKHYSANYDLAYSRNITRDFIKHIAVTQKWIDKSISGNTLYNPELFPNGKIPANLILSDMFYAKKMGTKTLYYNNVMVSDEDGQVILPAEISCAGGSCHV